MKNRLQAPSQLIIRHADRFAGQPLLLVNAPDPEVASELDVQATWNLHAGYAKRWQRGSGVHHFGELPPHSKATAALVWLPKEKPLTDYIVRALASVLPTGSTIWLVGENRSGIKSIHKVLPDCLEPAQKITSGNHSLLIATAVKQQTTFALESFLTSCELPQPGQEEPLHLASYPGVFAFPSIDAGSAMLLQHLPQWQRGKLLDFACGHGVLGAWLNRAGPELDVSYLDVSCMALAATRKTLEQNGLTGTLLAEEGLPSNLPRYDYVVSHPPFHTGLATDYKIGEQFLRDVHQHLTLSGELWLVANRFLPWPELLEKTFGTFDKITEDNRFAVYRARLKSRDRKRH